MMELSKERIEQKRNEETVKKESADAILRCIYARYMHMYEQYFADIDALNDVRIAEMRKSNEETLCLIRYYYMDIPMDVCAGLKEFEKQYNANLLGPDWHRFLFSAYEDFREANKSKYMNEGQVKAAFEKEALEGFYDAMDYVLRDGFGTASQTAHQMMNGISGLLFGKEKKS